MTPIRRLSFAAVAALAFAPAAHAQSNYPDDVAVLVQAHARADTVQIDQAGVRIGRVGGESSPDSQQTLRHRRPGPARQGMTLGIAIAARVASPGQGTQASNGHRHAPASRDLGRMKRRVLRQAQYLRRQGVLGVSVEHGGMKLKAGRHFARIGPYIGGCKSGRGHLPQTAYGGPSALALGALYPICGSVAGPSRRSDKANQRRLKPLHFWRPDRTGERHMDWRSTRGRPPVRP